MPVCIAGMHRSGTSMVAKMLHLCGLYLGQEGDLMIAQRDNPDGFWENRKFVALNDEILNELGGGWDCPPSMPNGWNEEEGFLRLRAEAEVILQEFLGYESWGWKDPRNSLTLPFWQSFFPKIKIVICLRNPLEVALSLRRRNFLSYSLGLTLWKVYNQRILESTPPEHRIITHYDAYFPDPDAELRRVLDFLDVLASEEVVERCCSVASADLRHNRFTIQHLRDAGVVPEVFNLYTQMCAEAGWLDDNTDHPARVVNFPDSVIRQSLHRWDSKAAQAPLDGQLEEVAVERRQGMRQLDRSVVEVELLRRELEERTAWARRTAEEVTQRDATIRELQAQLEERTAWARRTAEEVTQRDATIRELQEQLDATQNQFQEVRKEREGLWRNVTKQTKQLNDLRTIVLALQEHLLRRDDDLQTALYDLQTAQAVSQLSGTNASKQIAYHQLIRRIREVVRITLPRDATVIVVSKGDNELLKLYGRKVWHFPQTADGVYAGYNPADSTAAIAHLEALRARGGDYLLFPETALWWLDHYVKFKQYLEYRYCVVVNQKDTGVIFDLREPAVLGTAGWWIQFEEMIAEYQSRFDRDPAILDWNTGLELATGFPQHTIFSPPTADSVLPYLDQSIDIVVVSSPDLTPVSEAHRVAKGAVITFTHNTQGGAEPDLTLNVDWKVDQTAAELPTVSIIIPSYNGIAYTEALLGTLRETLPGNFRGEIIVVDDASTDDTQVRLKRLAKLDKRLKVLRNRKNSGFIMTCNRGAAAATGEIIIFFNNDTLALPGWLPPLLRTFRDYPDAGAVGGKLIFPDGRLQEAGGVVFSDGSAANFGKWDYEVDAPLYNYVREVDYVTGAFIATKRSLFMESGGFDTRFRPIYYEETDYCFRLREMGYRVYYQPESAIIHLEGATSGIDPSKGDKRYQVVNRAKFLEKWSHVLKRQLPPPSRFDLATWYALSVHEELEGVETQ